MGATEKLYNAIPSIRFNPTLVTRYALQMVEEKINGQFDLVNPTNPFVMLLEGSSTLASAACTDGESVLRKMYESLAMNDDELYLHMSDRDYVNRFASPAIAPFSLFFGLDDIVRNAVQDPSATYRKLVIPKHTELKALDIPFTMQYPIEIRIQPHGGIDTVWVKTENSPIETIASNIVEHKYTQIVIDPQNPTPKQFIRLNFALKQFAIESHKGQLNLATTYRKTFAFNDQFYYARVYITNSQSTWSEIRTTHTEQVFDPTVPTAVLRVSGNTLRVMIPQVYMVNGLISGEIRIDIYTTRGSMDQDLANLAPEAYAYKWRDLDKSVDSRYYAPLSDMSMAVISTGSVTGGNNRLSFDTLRQRVITNAAGSVQVPITNVQVTSYLQDRGYSAVTDVDNVTNRDFLATRLLPVPKEGPVVSNIGLSVQTLSATFEELAAIPTIVDNTDRITILPNTLYTDTNGVTEIVPQITIDSILALSPDDRIERLNEKRYVYSPFHYVLDMSNDRFDTRVYYLDAPLITERNYITSNNTIPMSVSIRRFSIERNSGGYQLSIEVLGDETWDALDDSDTFCQLGFIAQDEIDYAVMNGTFIGLVEGNRVYQFQINTSYDVNEQDFIGLTSFRMYGDPERIHFCPLKTDFSVITGVSNWVQPGATASVIDLNLNMTAMLPHSYGLTQETLTIQLGYDLDGLWTSSRSIPSSLDYQKYLTDVPATYREDVYERDSTGAKVWSIVDNKVVFNILHHVGDPIVDENNNTVYLARAGDVMLDNDGDPIIVNSRKMLRQTDLITIDGLYYFATDKISVDYRKSVATLMVNWVSTDIRDASTVLLEQSRLFFYPQVTFGYIDAIADEHQEVRLRADQRFMVTYYVSAAVFRDIDLRTSIAVAGRMAINSALQRRVVTTNSIIDAITTKVGSNVIGVKISPLGDNNTFNAITMIDDSARLAIGKRAVAYPDGTIGIEDDVSTSFIMHTSS